MKKLGIKMLISIIIFFLIIMLIISSFYMQNKNVQLSNVASESSLKTTENYTWTQDKTVVNNGEVTLEVGSKITGYEASGVSDWYVLGAESGRLLLTTNYNPEGMTLYRISSNVNGVSTLNNAASVYKNVTLASSARSINVNDINRVTGYSTVVNAVDYGKNNCYWYGNKITYTRGSYTTNGTRKNTKFIGTKYPTQDSYYFADANKFYYPSSLTRLGYFYSGSMTFTSNLYKYYPQTLSTTSSTETNINGSSLAYSLLFANTSGKNNTSNTKGYWLANTYIETCYGYILWRTFWSRGWYGYRFSDGTFYFI